MALVLAIPAGAAIYEAFVFVLASAAISGLVYMLVKPGEFTHRGDGAGPDGGQHDRDLPRWYRDPQKKGTFIQPDRAGDRAHGGEKQWKVFSSKGKRQGTVNDEGEKIRDTPATSIPK